MLKFIFSDNNTLKLSDTLKSKLKDTADISNSDRSKDKSPTPSLKNSPKVSKKNHISIVEEFTGNSKESNHENELPPSVYYILSSCIFVCS